MMSADEFSMTFPRTSLQDAVKGDRRQQLEAIRDYIAHELEANLCNTCRNSKLRTGDQASLILRLQAVLEQLDTLPSGEEEVTHLESLRLRVVGAPSGDGSADAEDQPLPGEGKQRRSGSRRVGSDGRSAP